MNEQPKGTIVSGYHILVLTDNNVYYRSYKTGATG